MHSVICNISSYYSNWKQLSIVLCAHYLEYLRKALGLECMDGAVFCVSRAVVSEREQETCCSPEPVRTRTTRAIAPLRPDTWHVSAKCQIAGIICQIRSSISCAPGDIYMSSGAYMNGLVGGAKF